jgi:hypothetical protein
MVEKKYAYKILVGKRGGKRPLGRHTRRWKEIGCEDVDWIHLTQDASEKCNETSASIKEEYLS